MSIVLTCGQNSGYMRAHKSLVAAGLTEAAPSRHEQYSPTDISRAICESYKINVKDPETIGQIEPGKVWQALSGDLMLANLSQPDWGWADPNTIYLLNYWRDYDPLLKFVLTYSSPEKAVAELLAKEAPSSNAVEQILAIWQAVNSGLLSFYCANKDRAILVNSSVVSEDTGRFINLARTRLDVNLTDAPGESYNAKEAAIPDLLATLLIEGAQDAQSLYQELESAADMPEYAIHERKMTAYKAWGQYRDHKIQLGTAAVNSAKIKVKYDEQKQRVDQMHAELIQLRQQKEELTQRHEQRVGQFQAEILQLRQQKDGLTQRQEQRVGQFQAEILQLRQQKDQQKDELTQRQEQRVGQLQAQMLQLQQQKDELSQKQKQEVERPQAQIIQLSAERDEQKQENELLLLQLHQVQEELEHYYLKYQEATKSGVQVVENEKTALTEPETKATGATGAIIDLRQFIDGDNWYYAEHDGRWAGPGLKSTLRLPALSHGQYRLELDVADAMAPELLSGMVVSLNGKPLNLKSSDGLIGPWASVTKLYRKKLKYPVLLTGSINISKHEADMDMLLELSFPKTISPSSRGSDDMRDLTIRVKQVKLLEK